ncbi:Exopolyphosphatase [Yamadazyma tenuis]|uniref:DHH phosphoesterase n=1 Tax=Candida tenuis (strain ATCC 10573 / BCRC 21748 / CBS 615 / JCM 9827 / NBRC 10315 / NRRL Y-1498 / VKM Y-70) TaxID=590646 RepID=G3BFL6_CANTC|nr:DHH phosphoesterase [Yamadazyma tenuis ATCC 10573]EGV60047.1 DHH phosphoesterase [Yamadazyma tenuis ATCC 10573]WEJ94725.1 Exopolyphosphatase [Yamadazyma tenuis]
MSVKAFLQVVKKHIGSSSLEPLRFVTGNQSADLDSVISAIGYSYLNYKYDSTVFIPLINIPRQDFSLRRDIKLVLETNAITEDLLYFIEDFKNIAGSRSQTEITLVDHCNLQGESLIEYFHNHQIKVTGIIDHHADENVFLDANPRTIKTCGSCSSLVFNHWSSKFENLDVFKQNSGEIVKLFTAPLLIDTNNMSDKVEEDDRVALQLYKQVLQQEVTLASFDEHFTNYHQTIKRAKKNLDGFKVDQVLRKDYKQFKFGGINIGFSSIGKSAEWLFKSYSNEEILSGLNNVIDFFHLDMVIATPSYTDKQNQYRREFIVAYPETSQFEELGTLEPRCSTLALDKNVYNVESFEAKLDELNKSITVRVWNQTNLAASRKQIVPAVKDILDK